MVIISLYIHLCALCAAQNGYTWNEAEAINGGCYKCNKPTMVMPCKTPNDTIIEVNGDQIIYKQARTNLP